MFLFLTKQKQKNQVSTQTLKSHEGPKMYFKITLVSNDRKYKTTTNIVYGLRNYFKFVLEVKKKNVKIIMLCLDEKSLKSRTARLKEIKNPPLTSSVVATNYRKIHTGIYFLFFKKTI